MDQESYAQAVVYYAKTSKLLEHYRSLSVFSSIEMECKEIMDKITKRIRENMTRENACKTLFLLFYLILFNFHILTLFFYRRLDQR